MLTALVLCVGMSAASYAQEPRQMEANAQVAIVSGIGTHGSFGGGMGVALAPRVRGYGEFSYIPLGGNTSTVAGLQAGGSVRAYNFNAGGQYDLS